MARTLDVECEIMNEKKEQAERMLISCLLQDLSLETPLLESDFSTPKNKFYFKLITELAPRYKEINGFTVLNYLQISEEMTENFNDFGGVKEFDKIKSMANVSDFNSYLDELVKFKLVEELSEKLGIDINKEVTVGGKRIIPANIITGMNSSQTLDFFDMQLSSINVASLNNDMIAESLYYTEDEISKMESGELEETSYFDYTLLWEDEKGEKRFDRNLPLLNRSLDGYTCGNGVHYLGGFSGTGKSTILINIILGLITTSNEKVILVSNEQRSSYFKRILVSYIAQSVFKCYTLDRTKIKHFNFTDEEKRAFYLANEFVKENFTDSLKFYSVSEFNIDKILREVKRLHLAEGYSVLCLETFKSQSALDNSVADMVDSSRKLDIFEKEVGMKVILPVQLMTSLEGKVSYLNSSMISNSKQIKEVANSIILVRKVNERELDPEDKAFLNPYVWKTNKEGKLIKKYLTIIDGQERPKRKLKGDEMEKDYTLDKRKKYLLCFIDKSRESDDNSKVILMEMVGRIGKVRDVCYVDNVYTGTFY
jgi:replicative DNA helicase